ncbi:hypothetical protein JX266_006741 [Neoarthrinium moseri]|nr:hypothetical protein JX266_006741 [Neoarthrinium moseri]
MDVRPSRPARPLHATTNENFPPSKQTLLQRHKSTGTLRPVPSVGGLQVAAKRSAFADRSNTSKTTMAFDKGKMAAAKPQVANAKENASSVYVAPKDAFLRPAQRPSFKGSSQLAHAAKANHGHSKSLVSAHADSRLPPAVMSKPNKRASTIVYNDNTSDNSSRPSTSGSGSGAIISEHIEAVAGHDSMYQESSTAAVAPLSRKPRHHQSQPVLKSSQQQPASLLDTDVNRVVPWEVLPVIKSDSSVCEDDAPEAPYLDAVEELSPERFLDFEPAQPEYVPPHERLTNPITKTATRDVEQEAEHPSAPAPASAGLEHLEPLGPLVPLEPSDHEDEDLYDEQGYTTAHSYRDCVDIPIAHDREAVEAEAEPETSLTVTIMEGPKFSKQILDEIQQARHIVEKNRTDEEIEEEAWDISMVAEYGDEIFEYMKEMEITLLPSAHYMDIQTEIQWSMRSVLMDWVIQVHGRFNLLPETLFLAVNYIDRFLSVKVVSLGKLQLVGATAIFLAAKYEEINCPSVQEIVYMVDSGYSVEEILKAERYMLSMLDFNLGWPGPMSFLRRISKADDYDLETRTLAKYFLEVTIMDERFVASPPSFVSAGAHCLSRLILEKGHWTPEHVHYSGYTYAQLQPLVAMILECCTIAEKHHQAVLEKYADKRFKKCALFVRGQIKGGFRLEPAQAPAPARDVRYDDFPYSWSSANMESSAPSHLLRMPIPMQG